MKKNLRVKLLCLTLCSAALVFTGISCTANQNGDTPPPSESENVNKHSIEPVYDEETGVVSWRAVEGATKYAVIVNLRHQNGITAAYETTGLSQQLSLKQGISLITVVAYKDGTEVGNGVVTVELALDFEHPGTPTEIVYDKENGVLSWREAEKAAKYKITVSGVTDKSFALEKETARNSET
ncbi:MAG: hypothetical protein ACI4RO_04685, partial [Candidatus Scatosoma sp.]